MENKSTLVHMAAIYKQSPDENRGLLKNKGEYYIQVTTYRGVPDIEGYFKKQEILKEASNANGELLREIPETARVWKQLLVFIQEYNPPNCNYCYDIIVT